jgi:hypothetical protein
VGGGEWPRGLVVETDFLDALLLPCHWSYKSRGRFGEACTLFRSNKVFFTSMPSIVLPILVVVHIKIYCLEFLFKLF